MRTEAAVYDENCVIIVEEKVAENSQEQGVTKQTSFYSEYIEPIEKAMMTTIWRILRHEEETEDTLQDALAITWRKRDRVRAHPNPRALILKICIEAAYDTLRKRGRRKEQENPGGLHNIPDPSHTPVPERLERAEIREEVLSAIAQLPKKQALAVLLRVVRREPYDKIAAVLGCSETTVRIHVSRGRKRLARRLEHLNPGSPGEEIK